MSDFKATFNNIYTKLTTKGVEFVHDFSHVEASDAPTAVVVDEAVNVIAVDLKGGTYKGFYVLGDTLFGIQSDDVILPITGDDVDLIIAELVGACILTGRLNEAGVREIAGVNHILNTIGSFAFIGLVGYGLYRLYKAVK